MRGCDTYNESELLRALAQQLKLPLTQIARLAELAGHKQDLDCIKIIEQIAEATLSLTDNYILGASQFDRQPYLEPVSAASVMRDSHENLRRLAASRNCQIRLQLDRNCEPIMADPDRLAAAITSLGHSFIEAVEPNTESLIILTVHKNSSGIVAGVFGAGCKLTTASWHESGKVIKNGSQLMPNFSAQTSAGVYIADTILNRMDARLKVSKYQKLSGLAAVFQPVQQLQLIS